MNEFEEAMRGAYSRKISEYELATMRDYLAGEIHQEEIDQEIAEGLLGSYWNDFRLQYAEHGDDAELMLEALREDIGTRSRDTYSRESFEKRPEPVRIPPTIPAPTTPSPGREPLPEPALPDVGRRRGDRGWKALLRPLRGIRRFFS